MKSKRTDKLEHKVYSFVGTPSAVYFGIVDRMPNGNYVVSDSIDLGHKLGYYQELLGYYQGGNRRSATASSTATASDYIQSELADSLRAKIELSESQVSYVLEAGIETERINYYRRLLPQAKQRALSRIIMEELHRLDTSGR